MAAFMAALPMLQTVGSILGGIGSIAQVMKKDKAGAAPAVTPPTEMPTPDGERVRQARRRSLTEQMRRQGRESTILTEYDDTKLGG